MTEPMFRLLLCVFCAIPVMAQLPVPHGNGSGMRQGVPSVEPPWSPRKITVQQLEEILAAARQKRQSDEKVSRQLAGVEASERLTDERLNKLGAEAGPRTREALRMIADASVFFELPVAERLPDPPPDVREFRLIAARAAQYTLNYVRGLPDFLCTRSTRRYSDYSAPGYTPDNPEIWARLRLQSTAEGELSYNRGAETYTPRNGQKEKLGLSSFGEFSAIIGTLFAGDSAAQIRWSHWERLAGLRAAVFRYSIDSAHSSYKVSHTSQHGVAVKTVAYDGWFFVEPESGAILRITRQAQGLEGFPLSRADTFVEYSRVEIGPQSYVCPSRSVTYSAGFVSNWNGYGTAHYVNEVRFTDYRKFAAESTVSAM